MNTLTKNQKLISTLLGWSPLLFQPSQIEDDLIKTYILTKSTNVVIEENKEDETKIEEDIYIRDHKSLFNILDQIKVPKVKLDIVEESKCFEFFSSKTERLISFNINFSDEYSNFISKNSNFSENQIVNNQKEETKTKEKYEERKEKIKLRANNKEKYIQKQNDKRVEKKKIEKIQKEEDIYKSSVQAINKKQKKVNYPSQNEQSAFDNNEIYNNNDNIERIIVKQYDKPINKSSRYNQQGANQGSSSSSNYKGGYYNSYSESGNEYNDGYSSFKRKKK